MAIFKLFINRNSILYNISGKDTLVLSSKYKVPGCDGWCHMVDTDVVSAKGVGFS